MQVFDEAIFDAAVFDTADSGPTPVPTTPVDFGAVSGRRIVPVLVDANFGGDNPLVTGRASQAIRVLGVHLLAEGNVSLTWKSGTTVVTGPMPMIAGRQYEAKGIVARRVLHPLFECARGDDLVLALSDNIAVGGHVLIEITGF